VYPAVKISGNVANSDSPGAMNASPSIISSRVEKPIDLDEFTAVFVEFEEF
jgi:hypothetical protein